MNDTIIIDAMRWHSICHELGFGSDRREQFENCFACSVHWQSRIDRWAGEDVTDRPNPVMLLTFENPKDAVLFSLRWS